MRPQRWCLLYMVIQYEACAQNIWDGSSMWSIWSSSFSVNGVKHAYTTKGKTIIIVKGDDCFLDSILTKPYHVTGNSASDYPLIEVCAHCTKTRFALSNILRLLFTLMTRLTFTKFAHFNSHIILFVCHFTYKVTREQLGSKPQNLLKTQLYNIATPSRLVTCGTAFKFQWKESLRVM